MKDCHDFQSGQIPVPPRLTWVWLFLWIVLPAEPGARVEAASRLPMKVEVRELAVQARRFHSLQRFSGRISLRLRVTGQSPDPLTLKATQLRLLCDGSECRQNGSMSVRLLPETRQLARGESLDGWVTFAVDQPSAVEPQMRLIWTIGDGDLEVDINHALRDLVDPSQVRIGPRGVLNVLTIHRTIDLLTVWILTEQLRALKADGVERVVVDARLRQRVRLPSDVTSWLASVHELRAGELRPRAFRVTAPFQFREFHVSGFRHQGNPSENIIHTTREQAVAAALKSAYVRLPQQEAISGLQSPYPGVRRAALSGSIDRLTPPQLQRVLQLAGSTDVQRQRLVLEHLDCLPGPEPVRALRELLLEYLSHTDRETAPALTPENARIAAATLVRCIAPGVDEAMATVWHAAGNSDEVSATMIQEILRTKDHRWVRATADFALKRLNRISKHHNHEPRSEPADTSENPVSGSVANSDPESMLPDVLWFLHAHDPSFVDLARERLLDTTAPQSQDVLLAIVRQSETPEDKQLLATCISERLAEGTITSELLAGIRAMPRSEWTDRLLHLHLEKGNARYRRAPVLIAALRCASDDQLDRLCDDFLKFDRSARGLLLQQFMSMQHSRRLELFESALDIDETFSSVLRLIPQNATPEMLQLLLDRLEPLWEKAESSGQLDGHLTGRARLLLTQVGVFDHPEARRMINLWRICTLPAMRDEATELISRSRGRSPVPRKLQILWDRKAQPDHDHENALKSINSLIEQDPFFPDSYLFRASLFLRNDDVRKAMDDVLAADKLNPRDPTIESTIALARVRSGDMNRGIKDAESVLKRVPEDVQPERCWTLYNTACVYGRAIEQPGVSPDQRQLFLERAIELFAESVDTGFDDEHHVRNDPDLVTLHRHPDWNRLLQQIGQNEARQQ